MDARLLPEFAYAANPYLMAQNAEWITSWGFPNLFIPASPIGFAATPPSYAFQYVTGLPIFQYQPTGWLSLAKTFLGVQYPIYPYATTAETIYGAAIPLAAKTTETGMELLSGLAAAGLFAFAYSQRGARLGIGLLEKLFPGIGSGIERLAARAATVPLIGGFLGETVPSMIGGTIVSTLAVQPALMALGWLSEQAGEAVGGTISVAHSLSRYMIGTEEFQPATGEISLHSAAEIYSKIMETSTEHPLLDRDTLLAVTTVAPRLGMLESVEPNIDQIVKAIKGISAYLRIVSELARDPSMMDTLQRVAEFMEGGATLTQAISFYHQFGIQAMAGGTTLNDIYESVLQPLMQSARQANVLPITAAVAYMSALPFVHGFAPFVNNSPLQPYFALMGGPQGYSLSITQRVLQNAYNPIWMMAEHEVGPFGGHGMTPQQYYEWLYNRPVELQKEISEVGATNYVWEQSARIVDMLRRYGITDKGMLYQVAVQLGADPLVVRAILEKQMGTYMHGMAHAKVAEAQARLSDLINTTELETYGIAGQMELLYRKVEAFVQHPFSTITGAIADWWTNLRLDTRFYPETMSPIGRKVAVWLFGETPEEFKRLFHLTKEEQNFYEMVLHGSEEEAAEILKLGLENLPKMKQIESARDWYPFFGKQEYKIWAEVEEKAALYLPELEHQFHLKEYFDKHVKSFEDIGKAVVDFFEEHKKEFATRYGKENLFDIQRILKYYSVEYAKKRFFKGENVDELQLANRVSEQIEALFSSDEKQAAEALQELTGLYTSEKLLEKYGLAGNLILDALRFGLFGKKDLFAVLDYVFTAGGFTSYLDLEASRYMKNVDTHLVERVFVDALKYHSPRAMALIAYMQAIARGEYDKAGEIAEKYGFSPEKMKDVRSMLYFGKYLQHVLEKKKEFSSTPEGSYVVHLAEFLTGTEFTKGIEKSLEILPTTSTTELLASQTVLHGLEILTNKKISAEELKSPTDQTVKYGIEALRGLSEFLKTYHEYQKTHDVKLKEKLQQESQEIAKELSHLPTATASALKQALLSGDYEKARELTLNLFKTSVLLEHPDKLKHLSQTMVLAAEDTHKALEGVVKDLRELGETLEMLGQKARQANTHLRQAYGNTPFLTPTSH